MKYLFLLTLILFLQFALTTQNQKPDFQLDQFYPKWGAKNIESPTDIQASTKVYSDGEKIHIEVEVVDDMLVNDVDVLHTDHVEVWFGVGEYHLLDDDKDHTEKEDFFEAQLQSRDYPGCYVAERPAAPKYLIFEKLSSKHLEEINSDLLSMVDSVKILGWEKYIGDLPIELDFTGITHFGLFPDNRTLSLYDRENYELFEKSTDYQIGDLTEGCTYSAKITDKGYIIEASFTPKALGFVQLPSIKNLFIMIDVVDVDERGSQETILSSSKNRTWGNKYSFNWVELQKPLNTNVVNIPKHLFEFDNSALSKKLKFSPKLVYTQDGWKYYNSTATTLAGDWEIFRTHFTTYGYLPTSVNYKTDILKQGQISASQIEFSETTPQTCRNFDFSQTSFFQTLYKVHIIDDKVALSERKLTCGDWKLDNLEQIFVFADGTVGLITYSIDGCYCRGTCGGCENLDIRIKKYKNGEFQEILRIEDDSCCSLGFQIGDNEYEEMSVKEVVWSKVGKELKIWIDDSWGENKQPIKVIDITFNENGTVREIYPFSEKE